MNPTTALRDALTDLLESCTTSNGSVCVPDRGTRDRAREALASPPVQPPNSPEYNAHGEPLTLEQQLEGEREHVRGYVEALNHERWREYFYDKPTTPGGWRCIVYNEIGVLQEELRKAREAIPPPVQPGRVAYVPLEEHELISENDVLFTPTKELVAAHSIGTRWSSKTWEKRIFRPITIPAETRQAPSGWIELSERKPTDSDRNKHGCVLYLCKTGQMVTSQIHATSDTHWQPLPPHPGAEPTPPVPAAQDSRADFHAAFPDLPQARHSSGDYENDRTQQRWIGWQARAGGAV